MNEIYNLKKEVESLKIKLEEFDGKSSSRVATGLEKLRIEVIKGLSDRVTKLEKQVSVHSSDNHSSDNKNKNECNELNKDVHHYLSINKILIKLKAPISSNQKEFYYMLDSDASIEKLKDCLNYKNEPLIINYVIDLQKEIIKQSDCLSHLKNEIVYLNLSFNNQIIELCQKFNLDYSPNDA